MMRVFKKVVISGFNLLIILILLDFVPVKFAVTIDDAKKNLKDGTYICNIESKIVPETGWVAKKSLNKHLDKRFSVRVFGCSPNIILSEKNFQLSEFFEVENSFLLVGEVEKIEQDQGTKVLFADFYVNEWDIIYPIKRGHLGSFMHLKDI